MNEEETKIHIEPDFNPSWFTHNSLPFISLIGELIDNVAAELQNMDEGSLATVEVVIKGEWKQGLLSNPKKAQLIIKDNATGISRNRLAECLSLGKLTTGSNPKSHSNSLHEHAAGMKISIWTLGRMNSIVTKTKDELIANRIVELPTRGTLTVYDDSDTFKENESGTIIVIEEPTRIPTRKSDISRYLVPQLGAKYSRLLVRNSQTKKQLKIVVKIEDVNGLENNEWNVQPVEMHYKNNKMLFNEKYNGNNWCAELEFGLAAEPDEYIQYGKEPPSTNSNHPYRPWHQTIDIVMHDRVIKRIKAPDLVNNIGSHNSEIRGNFMVNYQGTLNLRYGFKTNIMKDAPVLDDNYNDLVDKLAPAIKQLLEEQANLDFREKEERDYTKDLALRWINGDGLFCYYFYKIPGVDGEIDILVFLVSEDDLKDTDLGEVIEMKVEEACGQDVYQVVYYVDNCDRARKDKARLIAPSFSQGCIETVKRVKAKYGLDVQLKTFTDMGLIIGNRRHGPGRKRRATTVTK